MSSTVEYCTTQDETMSESMQSPCKYVLESWRENCKLIWKLQTHMKIANSYENCKRPCMKYTLKRENCKLIWRLQTDMKIANWYENCKFQSNSHVLVYRSYVDICNFHMRHSGNETCSGTACFGSIAVWMTKTQRNNLSQNLQRFMFQYQFLC